MKTFYVPMGLLQNSCKHCEQYQTPIKRALLSGICDLLCDLKN